ncbi:MAG: T9SS type A sorting domain-containing protein, partial [Bacteroidetes bacterium]|nr:T9SS type A sorting domain-containing protein [Bacteroidota bacterium]
SIDSLPITVYAKSVLPITWLSSGIKKVNIYVSFNNRVSYLKLADTVSAYSFYYNWVVPDSISNQCYIKLVDASQPALFAESFLPISINSLTSSNVAKYKGGAYDGHTMANNLINSINLLAPNNADSLFGNTSYTISWKQNNVDKVNLYYSPDNGANWQSIVNGIAASSAKYIWTVANFPTNAARIKVEDASDNSSFSISANAFIIRERLLKITQPDSSSQVFLNAALPISWISGGISNIRIKIIFNNRDSVLVDSVAANNESYNWVLKPGTPDSFRIVLMDKTDASIADTSKQFKLLRLANGTADKFKGGSFDGHTMAANSAASLQLLSPNGKEVLSVSDNLIIKWRSNNVERITLNFSADSGLTWTLITANLAASANSYTWKTPNTTSAKCLVRVSNISDSTIFDKSDSVFIISAKKIINTTDSVNWIRGMVKSIEWQSSGVDKIKIQFKAGLKQSWQLLKDSIPATYEVLNWQLQNTFPDSVWIKLTDVSDTSVTTEKNYLLNAQMLVSNFSATKFHGGSFDGHAMSTNLNTFIKLKDSISFPQPLDMLVNALPQQMNATARSARVVKYLVASGNGMINVNMLSVTGTGKIKIGVFIPGDSMYVATDTVYRTICINPLKPNLNYSGKLILCTNEVISLTAPSGYAQYLWMSGDTAKTIQINSAKSVSLKVGDAGCYSVSSDTLVFTQNNNIIATISAASATEFCSGSSVVLTSSAVSGNQWFVNGVIIPSAIEKNYTATTSGNYTVIVTTNACASAPSAMLAVVVKPTPNQPILSQGENILSNPFNDLSFCAGGSILLSSNASNGNQWLRNGLPINIANNANYLVSDSGNYAVNVTINGCVSAMSNTAVISINPLPIATVSGTVSVSKNAPSPIITFTGFNATAPYIFTYNINGGPNQTIVSDISGVATLIASTAVSGVTSYHLMSVQESSGLTCSNSASGDAIVSVYPLPVANIFGDATVCQNSTEPIITFIGSDATAPYTFTYTINGGPILTAVSTGNIATVRVPTITAGTFVYQLLSVQESSELKFTSIYNVTASITILPSPIATISSSITLCKDAGQALVTFTGSNATAPYIFTYNIDGGKNQTIMSDGTGVAVLNTPNNVAGLHQYNLLSVLNFGISLTNFISGCSAPSVGASVVAIKPVPTATISGAASVCKDANQSTIVFTGSNATAPFVFTYSINGAAAQTIVSDASGIASLQVPTSTVASYAYNLISVRENNETACIGTVNAMATVAVNALPILSGTNVLCTNTSTQLVGDGTAAIINAWVSSNTNIATIDNNGLVTGIMPGNTTITYTNINGCSSNTILTVNANSVGGSVSGAAAVCASNNAGTLALSGNTGSVIRWESSTNGTTWTSIANSSNTLNYKNIISTTIYRAVVQNSICSIAYSNAAKIIVSSSSVGGTITGTTSVCAGNNNGTLNLSNQTGSIIRWESSINAGKNWTIIVNTTASLSFTNIAQTTQYRAVVQNSPCSLVLAYSSVATVTANTASVGGVLSAGSTVCAGINTGSISLSLQTGVVVRWESSINAGVSWTNIINTTNKLSFANLLQTTQYRAVVQNSICSIAYSSIAIINVNQASVGGVVSNNATVCAGANSGTLNLSGQIGNVIRWESSLNGSTWTSIVNLTTALTYTNITKTTQYRAVVQNSTCTIGYSSVAIITVNAATVAGTISGNATVCAGINSGALSISGQTGNVYWWEYSIDAGKSWVTIVNASLTQTYLNLTKTTQYRAVVQNAQCSFATTSIATITVNAASVGGSISGSTNFTNAINTGTLTLSGQTGKVVRWESSVNAGLSWTSIANVTNTLIYKNISKTTTYRAVVQNSICSIAYSTNAIITIGALTAAAVSLSPIIILEPSIKSYTLMVEVKKMEVLVYPNPTMNSFNLTIKANNSTSTFIKVFDVIGRQIESFKLNENERKQFGGNYNNGIYFVDVLNGAEHQVIKVIKH